MGIFPLHFFNQRRIFFYFAVAGRKCLRLTGEAGKQKPVMNSAYCFRLERKKQRPQNPANHKTANSSCLLQTPHRKMEKITKIVGRMVQS